ncbi:MAG: hypothetical protein WCJ24_02510 [Candidatus Saccharibacteria bacterium]
MPLINIGPVKHNKAANGFIIITNAAEWRLIMDLHKKLKMQIQLGGYIDFVESHLHTFRNELQILFIADLVINIKKIGGLKLKTELSNSELA